MLTVILSEMVAANIDAACSIPAWKLAGAAVAAASNMRLKVIPPEVTVTVEVGAVCELAPTIASFESADTGKSCGPLAGGFPKPSRDAGRKSELTPAPSGLKK